MISRLFFVAFILWCQTGTRLLVIPTATSQNTDVYLYIFNYLNVCQFLRNTNKHTHGQTDILLLLNNYSLKIMVEKLNISETCIDTSQWRHKHLRSKKIMYHFQWFSKVIFYVIICLGKHTGKETIFIIILSFIFLEIILLN